MSQDSPCIGICEIDESGYCVGCGRSADEIFGETDSARPARTSPPRWSRRSPAPTPG
jgi:predicted Fe-S protein YdhL (DUF1289 family)